MTTAPNPQDDKELLELAAKAAGIKGRFIERFTEDGHPAYSCGIGHSWQITPIWNAISNDGDALRLAVARDMTVCADGLATVSACSGYGHDKVMVTQAVCECGNDKSAATRRAIVRAAAAIGRQESSYG